MNLVRIITILIIYLFFTFLNWDFNISHWGTISRFMFATLTIVSAIGWWILGALIKSDKKEKEKETLLKKSSFQERMEYIQKQRNSNKN